MYVYGYNQIIKAKSYNLEISKIMDSHGYFMHCNRFWTLKIESLAMIHYNCVEFLSPLDCMDKTWLHHFTPESKEHSKP